MIARRKLNCEPAETETSKPTNRKSKRFRTFKRGLIEFSDKPGKQYCTLRDFSSYGARLEFDSETPTSDTFTLFIEENRVHVDCTVVWRSKNELGVEFVRP